MKTDFRRYARELADGEQASGLLPVIEKEIIHYEILCSLSNRGYLTMMTFQGGTSLRLCHGSPRYSEDLDFAAGNAFDDLDPEQIAADLQNDLLDGFDVSVRVRPPKASPVDGGVGVKKWLTIVDMAPARPDLPSQKIKLEVDSVPAYTREAMRLRTNYPGLPDSYASVYIPCQSLGEILADKLVSFANAEHVRYRDLWDIPGSSTVSARLARRRWGSSRGSTATTAARRASRASWREARREHARPTQTVGSQSRCSGS